MGKSNGLDVVVGALVGVTIGLIVALAVALSYAMGEGIFYFMTGSVTSGFGAGILATVAGFITLTGVAISGEVAARVL